MTPQVPASLVRALVLGVVLAAAYGPVYGAGFLQFDDPWLIVDNPYFAPDAWHTPWVAFTDLSHETRIALGAEYLPVRDLFVWLESRLFGIDAPAMHAMSVLLYGAAVLFLRGALLRTFGAPFAVEVASLLFALHPVHAESVAWLAGQKDVLALLFVCAALYVHAGESRRRAFVVPLLVVCACLSKAMAIAVVPLIAAQDLVRQRRPHAGLYVATTLSALACLALHVHVGHVVGMVTPPYGGSRLTTAMTMGPAWLEYARVALLPWHASIGHDLPDRTHWDAASLAGWGFVALWLALGVLALRRREPRVLYAWLWFFAPLGPVSQVLSPLQNRVTDRYLWLSVLAPCLMVGWLLAALRARLAAGYGAWLTRAGASLCALGLFALTLERATLFGDELLLFGDGTRKTRHDTGAPYQLAQALEARGDLENAEVAFREVLARAGTGRVLAVRHASNGLATLLARQGRLPEAERVLRAALARFPDDPKVRGNLAKVLRGLGREDEARRYDPGPGAPAPDGS